MASNTIWSVDIGKSSLKAVKLRRDRNNVEILAVDKIDYPVSGNGVDAAAQAREAIGIFRSRNDVRDPVAVTHPGQGTFYRSIKVPASDDKKLDAMVGYEASQQIPFPLDEVIWDYHVIDREYLPGEEREVALFAVRREAMDDFLLDFSNENLAVDVVSIGYLGLLNFIRHDLDIDEPAIILDIGAAHTDLVLIDGSRFWIRPLPHSGGDVTRAIMSRFKLSYAEAEKLKVESAKVPKQAVKIFQAVIQPKLKDLVGEIHRSIGYYRSQSGEVSFKRLFLLGNGSKVVGIKKFLEDQLGVQVTRVDSISHFRVNRDVNLRLLQAHLPSFASTLGCGLQGLGAGTCTVDLVPREERLRKEAGRKKKHAFIGAALVLVAILVAHFMIDKKLQEVTPVLSDAKGVLDRIKKDEGELKKAGADEEALGEIRGRQSVLKEFGEMRALALNGLSALETVLESFPNDPKRSVDDLASATDNESAETIRYLESDVRKMLWIPWMEVTKIPYGTEDQIQVPAYRFRVYAFITRRNDATKAVQFVREKFSTPLEEELARRQITVEPEVRVSGGDNFDELRYNPDAASKRGREKPVESELPEFWGVEVQWDLVPRHPVEKPKKKKAATEKRKKR